jgi:hypothetical protein
MAGPRIRGIGSTGCGGICCGGIGISIDGKSIQSASSSSIFDVVVLGFVGRESAERDRNVSLLRVDDEESG